MTEVIISGWLIGMAIALPEREGRCHINHFFTAWNWGAQVGRDGQLGDLTIGRLGNCRRWMEARTFRTLNAIAGLVFFGFALRLT